MDLHSEILSLNFGNVMYTTETYFEHQIKSRNNLMCNSFMLKPDDISDNKHTYYISIMSTSIMMAVLHDL